MSKLTPAEATDKHARRLKASVEDIRAGVNRVTEAPTKKAAQKIDKMRTRLMEAFDSGKVQRRLEAVTLDDWKNKMLQKGVNNISTGIDLSRDKVEKFYSELFPYQDNLQKTVKAMPDTTLEDSISRMTTWTRGMAKFERKG